MQQEKPSLSREAYLRSEILSGEIQATRARLFLTSSLPAKARLRRKLELLSRRQRKLLALPSAKAQP